MYKVEYTDEATSDLKVFGKVQQKAVRKAIDRVSQNPLPKNEGGYGNPLGNKHGYNLTGLCKIKLLKMGIRVIYKLVRDGEIMKIVVVAARADGEAYRLAAQRTAGV